MKTNTKSTDKRMTSTSCVLEGKEYRMDYEKTEISSGTMYHGTVYLEHILEFFFVIFKNGDPVLFSPLDTPDSRKDVIIRSITDSEGKLSEA